MLFSNNFNTFQSLFDILITFTDGHHSIPLIISIIALFDILVNILSYDITPYVLIGAMRPFDTSFALKNTYNKQDVTTKYTF